MVAAPPDPLARPPAPRGGTDALAALRAVRLALAAARAGAEAARAHSHRLRARAVGAAHAAAASRDLAESHRALWRHWHRAWSALAAADGPRLVRVCAYCGVADLALLVGVAGGATRSGWMPLPPWVREHLGAGALGVRLSHGACPACAEARLGSV